MFGLLGHFPQGPVRRKVAVGMAERVQVTAQQLEVQRFFFRDDEPLAIEIVGHAGEAPADVEREVDRIELDVCERVDQRGAARDIERGLTAVCATNSGRAGRPGTPAGSCRSASVPMQPCSSNRRASADFRSGSGCKTTCSACWRSVFTPRW